MQAQVTDIRKLAHGVMVVYIAVEIIYHRIAIVPYISKYEVLHLVNQCQTLRGDEFVISRMLRVPLFVIVFFIFFEVFRKRVKRCCH